jgi:hypothetical protein
MRKVGVGTSGAGQFYIQEDDDPEHSGRPRSAPFHMHESDKA